MSNFLKIIENAKRVDLNTKDENGKSYADKLHDDMNSMRKTDEQLSQMHSQGFHATISKARSVEQRMIDGESDDEFYDESEEPVDTDVDAETQAMLGDESDFLKPDDFTDLNDDAESFVDEEEIDESDYLGEPDEPDDDMSSEEDSVSFAEPDDNDYDDEVDEDTDAEIDEVDSEDMDEDYDDEVSDEVSDTSIQTESQESSVDEDEDDAEDIPDPEPDDISEGAEKDTDGITVDQTIKPVTSVKDISVNTVSMISKKEMVDLMNQLSVETIDVVNMLCDMNTFLGRKNAVNTIELDCGVKIPRSCYKLCLDVYHMMNDGDLGESWFESEKTNPLSVWGTALLMFPSDEHVDFMMNHGFDEAGHEEEIEEKE